MAYNYFADGFGKVADIAVRSKGKEIGERIYFSYVKFLWRPR